MGFSEAPSELHWEHKPLETELQETVALGSSLLVGERERCLQRPNSSCSRFLPLGVRVLKTVRIVRRMASSAKYTECSVSQSL